MGYIGAGISRFNTADSLTVTGDVTASGTVLPTGDTAAGDAAAVGFTSAEGLILTGQGSSSDLTIKNDADATVFSVPTGQQKILFPDNARALFGDGSDLQIYHDGSDSYINDTGTGNLRLAGSANVEIISSGGEFMAKFVADGASTLYHNNVAKIATTSSGVDVTGGLNTTGNVGINTTSGNERLNVHGAIGSSAASAAFGAGLERALMDYTGSVVRFGHVNGASGSAKPVTFLVGGSEKARFSTGALRIGQSSTDHPGSGNTTTGIGLRTNGDAFFSDADSDAIYGNRNNAGGVVSIALSGTAKGGISVSSSAVAFNTTSDRRLKSNIQDAESASDKIDAIQVRQFDWNVDDSHQDYGLIAQELQPIEPMAVTGDADSDEMMGVDYSKLVPMLIKEIQELRSRVAALEE